MKVCKLKHFCKYCKKEITAPTFHVGKHRKWSSCLKCGEEVEKQRMGQTLSIN